MTIAIIIMLTLLGLALFFGSRRRNSHASGTEASSLHATTHHTDVQHTTTFAHQQAVHHTVVKTHDESLRVKIIEAYAHLIGACESLLKTVDSTVEQLLQKPDLAEPKEVDSLKSEKSILQQDLLIYRRDMMRYQAPGKIVTPDVKSILSVRQSDKQLIDRRQVVLSDRAESLRTTNTDVHHTTEHTHVAGPGPEQQTEHSHVAEPAHSTEYTHAAEPAHTAEHTHDAEPTHTTVVTHTT